MNKEYNFKEFTYKDMFEIKLKDAIPNFGYMSCSKRSKFFKFCVDAGFMEFSGASSQRKRYAYTVLVSFIYSAMGNYRPTDVECYQGQIIVIDSAFRAREKLNSSYGLDIHEFSLQLPIEYSDA